jgi:hypothetical protein
MDEQLNAITKVINELGKISQKSDQTYVKLNCQQENATQIIALKQRTIDDVVLRKIQQIDTRGKFFYLLSSIALDY